MRPTSKCGVIGCMAQRLGESLKKELPGVDRVIGAQELVAFTQDIDHIIEGMHAVPAAGAVTSPISTFYSYYARLQ